MTPPLTPAELAARHIFDPIPGSIHIRDLIDMAKDGIYVKDKVSDYVVGMIILARDLQVIHAWEGTLFQLPFVRGMKLRSSFEHFGHPLLDPNGDVLVLEGRELRGDDSDGDLTVSALTLEDIKQHPHYEAWLNDTLYASADADSGATYVRVRNNSTLKACDAYVNSLPYTPGPLSTPPPAATGAAASTPRKKRASGKGKKVARAPGRAKAAAPPAATPAATPSSSRNKIILRIGPGKRKRREEAEDEDAEGEDAEDGEAGGSEHGGEDDASASDTSSRYILAKTRTNDPATDFESLINDTDYFPMQSEDRNETGEGGDSDHNPSSARKGKGKATRTPSRMGRGKGKTAAPPAKKVKATASVTPKKSMATTAAPTKSKATSAASSRSDAAAPSEKSTATATPRTRSRTGKAAAPRGGKTKAKAKATAAAVEGGQDEQGQGDEGRGGEQGGKQRSGEEQGGKQHSGKEHGGAEQDGGEQCRQEQVEPERSEAEHGGREQGGVPDNGLGPVYD